MGRQGAPLVDENGIAALRMALECLVNHISCMALGSLGAKIKQDRTPQVKSIDDYTIHAIHLTFNPL